MGPSGPTRSDGALAERSAPRLLGPLSVPVEQSEFLRPSLSPRSLRDLPVTPCTEEVFFLVAPGRTVSIRRQALPTRLGQEDCGRDAHVQTLSEAQHRDRHQLIGRGQHLGTAAPLLATQDNRSGLRPVDLEVRRRPLIESGDVDTQPPRPQLVTSGGRIVSTMNTDPPVNPPRDHLRDLRLLGKAIDHRHATRPKRIDISENRGCVVGVMYVFDDNLEVVQSALENFSQPLNTTI